MSFISVTDLRGLNRGGFKQHANKFAIGIGMHASAKKTRMAVTFYEGLVQQLGWNKGDKVDFLWGHGENAGKALIRRSDKGLRLQAPGSGENLAVFVLAFPASPEINRTKHVSEDATYKIEDGALLVTLPAWLFKRAA